MSADLRAGPVTFPADAGRDRDPAGWGYLHIRDDEPRRGAVGHGDPLVDSAFDLEIADTLERGVEARQGGGNWRYTLRYRSDGECTDGWGFRVMVAKLPLLDDGYPAGIITAFCYESAPPHYP